MGASQTRPELISAADLRQSEEFSCGVRPEAIQVNKDNVLTAVWW